MRLSRTEWIILEEDISNFTTNLTTLHAHPTTKKKRKKVLGRLTVYSQSIKTDGDAETISSP